MYVYIMGVDVRFFGRLMHTCDIIFLCVCVLSWGKEQPGRDADPSPPSSAMVMNK